MRIAPVYIDNINGKKIDKNIFSSYKNLAYLKPGDRLTLDYKNSFNSDSKKRLQLTAEHVERKAVEVSIKDQNLILQVKSFRRGTIHFIKKALSLAYNKKKLIIDLRHSPGGDIYALVDWLSLLLNDDIPVITLRKQSEQHKSTQSSNITLFTLPGKIEQRIPIIIIVSEYTASSAEIFARILRTQIPGTLIIGRPSKGKCLAQSNYALGNLGALKLSTYNVELIDSGSCEGIPIQPDILKAGVETYNLQQINQLVEQVAPANRP
ncbi:S41 family peptidase [Motiliproteus sp. MSK22-1]|uniref:S41 family peptidase n=1 Tax=Motiliproteus sp. MSK22-1 TaxID=1897630 RepID=UPI000977AB3C|nr:S41 family peptidase [Motiliproteus sp. MSK22-1]OMH30275.1 hypothetical protein BGP75_17945 [Motiliproteus sp. MSK22-1]